MSDLQGAVSRAKELVRGVGRPVVAKLRPRIGNIAIDRLQPELDVLYQHLANLRGDLERVEKDLDGHVKWLYDEQRRLAPHLAALEARVAAIERPGAAERPEKLEYSADEAEELRAEHARIRARLAAISKYEERLARLEASLSPQTDGKA